MRSLSRDLLWVLTVCGCGDGSLNEPPVAAEAAPIIGSTEAALSNGEACDSANRTFSGAFPASSVRSGASYGSSSCAAGYTIDLDNYNPEDTVYDIVEYGDAEPTTQSECERQRFGAYVWRTDGTNQYLGSRWRWGAELRRRAGSALEDDALPLEVARQVLGGSWDEGRSAYQLAVTVCAECGAGRQDAGSDVVAIGADVLEMARRDAQHLGRVDVAPVRPSDAEELRASDGQQLKSSGGPPLGCDVWPANDSAPHVGCPQDVGPARQDVAVTGPARQDVVSTGRATQDVPPAVRRAVLRRDHGRCRVPGCRNAAEPITALCIAAISSWSVMLRGASAFGMPTAPSGSGECHIRASHQGSTNAGSADFAKCGLPRRM